MRHLLWIIAILIAAAIIVQTSAAIVGSANSTELTSKLSKPSYRGLGRRIQVSTAG